MAFCMKLFSSPTWLFVFCSLGALLMPVEAWAQNRFNSLPEPRVSLGLVPEGPEGMIKVGTPQVYSRQLVFRDRAEEIQYLSDRLKAAKEFPTTFQGIVDSRFYTALGLQMALSVDPLTGRIADQSKINQALNLEQQVQMNELENEIKVLDAQRRKEEAKKLLEAAKKPAEDPKEGEDAPNPILPAPAVDDQARKDIAALQSELAALKSAGPTVPADANNRVKSAPAAETDSTVLKNGGREGKETTASLTQIEKERAVLEVRRFLQNERRRLSFDGMHDAEGSIAVDLGMLVTMIPPKGRDAYAVVEAYVEDVPLPQSLESDKIVKVWADHLLSAIQLEKEFLDMRMASDALPFGEKYFQLAVQELQREALNKNLAYEAEAEAKMKAEKAAAEKAAADAKEQADKAAREVAQKSALAEMEKRALDAARKQKAAADKARSAPPGAGNKRTGPEIQALESQFSVTLDKEKLASVAVAKAEQELATAEANRTVAEIQVEQAEQKKEEVEKEMTVSQAGQLGRSSMELLNQSSLSATSLFSQKLLDRLDASKPPETNEMSLTIDPIRGTAVVTGGGADSSDSATEKKMLTLLDQLILTMIPIQEQEQERKRDEELKKEGNPFFARLMRKYRERLLNTYLGLYFGDCLQLRDLGKGYESGDFLSLMTKKQVVECAVRTFLRKLSNDPATSRVRVLAVDPADQGQNISNVGATQSVSDIVMSLSAMMPNGIGGNGRMDSYRDSRLYLQSANRKPLVVGFVNGDVVDPSFGWVLGPRYEVALKRRWYQLGMGEPRATSTFTHEPTQHQVQVSIGMAAWTPELKLHLKTHWVDKGTGLAATPLKSSQTVSVRMTPDYTAMTEGMLDLIHGKRRPPRIFIGAEEEKFVLSSQDNKHKLVLLGKDMWRSPMVYLDSLPATSVDVMPGLVGVVATFEGTLPLIKKGRTDYDVTITTTDGFDTIYNRVESPKAPAAPAKDPGEKATVRLALAKAVIKHAFTQNGELSIPLNVLENPFPFLPKNFLEAKCFPLGLYENMEMATTKVGLNKTMAVVVGKADKPLKTVMPTLEQTSPSGKPGSALMSFTVTMQVMNEQAGVPEMRDVVKGNRQVLLVDPTQCVFTVPADTKFTLGAVAQELQVPFPTQVLAEHFKLAYPEFTAAVAAGKVTLQLVDKDPATRVYATLAMKAPAGNVEQGLYFRVPPMTEADFFKGLTLEAPKDAEQSKDYSLRFSFGNAFEKVENKVTLKVPKKKE